VTLTLVAIAAIGAAAYFYQTTRTRIDRTLGAATAFENARGTAIRTAFDIRSGQQAYVAAGQNEAFWFDKVATSVTELRSALAALAPATSSGEARAALTEASAALDELEQRDRRIRAYVSSGQRLLASDLIFSDGLELMSRVLTSLDRAGAAAARESQAARTDLLLSQMMAGGGAAIVTMLALLLLMQGGDRRDHAGSGHARGPAHARSGDSPLTRRSGQRPAREGSTGAADRDVAGSQLRGSHGEAVGATRRARRRLHGAGAAVRHRQDPRHSRTHGGGARCRRNRGVGRGR
jgi:hypothetical protein